MDSLVVKCFRSDGRNGLHELKNGDSINETDYFAITLQSSVRLHTIDLVLLITDFPFELEEKYSEGSYIYNLKEYSLSRYFREEGFDFKDYARDLNGLKMSKLFVNYPMGISEIQLFDNKKDSIIAEFRVNVVSDKLNESEFVSLVDYIEGKSIALWNQYSLLKNEASPSDFIDKNDWQLLFLQRFIQEVNEKLYFFEYDKLIVYKKDAKIVEYTSDVLVDEDSMYWLAQNLDTLRNTNSTDFEKILIQNRIFRPSEILSNSTIESTDIDENRFVHGFINELITFLNILLEEYGAYKFNGISNSFQEILYFYSHKRKIRLFNDYLERLKIIRSNLSDFIPVTETLLDYIPTHKISSKDHYQYIYEKFVEWFSYDRVRFSNNKLYFKGVTRMDKLFERACLYKLIDVFISLGYTIEIEKRSDGLPQVVNFTNASTRQSHCLYFETYPTRYNTQTFGWSLKPDFFIEFDNGGVLIMDSKYKKNSNVQKYDWEKLTLKYLHGIGYKNGERFTPIALFALVPASKNQTEFYQNKNYDLNSVNPALPSIGSVAVDFEKESLELFKYLSKCLELVYGLKSSS